MKKGQCDFDWTEELKKDLSSKEKLTEDNDTETFEEPMDKENYNDEVPKDEIPEYMSDVRLEYLKLEEEYFKRVAEEEQQQLLRRAERS